MTARARFLCELCVLCGRSPHARKLSSFAPSLVGPLVLRSRRPHVRLAANWGLRMRRMLISAGAVLLGLFVAIGEPSPQATAPAADADSTSLDELLAADCGDDSAMAVAQ